MFDKAKNEFDTEYDKECLKASLKLKMEQAKLVDYGKERELVRKNHQLKQRKMGQDAQLGYLKDHLKM